MYAPQSNAPIHFRNDSGAEIPAYGCMFADTGIVVLNDGIPHVKVTKPDTGTPRLVLFNINERVPDGGYGQAQPGPNFIALHSGSAPTDNTTVAPVSAQWYVDTDTDGGYLSIGEVDATSNTLLIGPAPPVSATSSGLVLYDHYESTWTVPTGFIPWNGFPLDPSTANCLWTDLGASTIGGQVKKVLTSSSNNWEANSNKVAFECVVIADYFIQLVCHPALENIPDDYTASTRAYGQADWLGNMWAAGGGTLRGQLAGRHAWDWSPAPIDAGVPAALYTMNDALKGNAPSVVWNSVWSPNAVGNTIQFNFSVVQPATAGVSGNTFNYRVPRTTMAIFTVPS